MLKPAAFLFIISISIGNAFGQNSYELSIITSGGQEKTAKEIITAKEKKVYKDSLQLKEALINLLNELHASGYAAAGIDSVSFTGRTFTASLFTGSKYEWSGLKPGNIPEDILRSAGIRKNVLKGKPIQAEKLSVIYRQIIKQCENNGYPFASIRLDSISISGDEFSASLALDKNRYIQIDSVLIRGNATIAPVYIYNYIGIRPGNPYSETQVRKIASRMKELPFLKEVKPSQVQFAEDNTKLYLFLENKKASQFDGVIGFQPDEKKTGKLNLTGEVHLKLTNSLKRGEIIELNWKQLPVRSQDLKIRALYPFVFNTPFGVEGKLMIFKKDTIYVDVTKNLGIQYALTGNNYIKAFINDKQSDLQSARGLENITVLPEYADITTVSYGATIHYELLDYRLNPRKGVLFELTGSTGNRKIRRNSEINKAAYDSISLKTVTYQGEIVSDYYFSPGGRHVINPGIQAAFVYNQNLFSNELFRIGGLRSLRGFDEESIFASKFITGKMEYRYLLEQNSFLFAFYNLAWYKNQSRNSSVSDTPYGFGAGINFETRLGIMSLSYALGKQFENPIEFRNGKVHFGIVNYF